MKIYPAPEGMAISGTGPSVASGHQLSPLNLAATSYQTCRGTETVCVPVCRCGMVYMPADDLGWRPFVASWLDRFLASHAATHQRASPLVDPEDQAGTLPVEPSQLDTPSSPALRGVGGASFGCGQGSAIEGSSHCPDVMAPVRSFLLGLFEQFVQPMLDWVRAKGLSVLPPVDSSMMAAVTAILETQVDAACR